MENQSPRSGEASVKASGSASDIKAGPRVSYVGLLRCNEWSSARVHVRPRNGQLTLGEGGDLDTFANRYANTTHLFASENAELRHSATPPDPRQTMEIRPTNGAHVPPQKGIVSPSTSLQHGPKH